MRFRVAAVTEYHRSRSWDRNQHRYVTWRESLEIAALEAFPAETAQDATLPEQATLARCTGHFEPLWARCPDSAGCARGGCCERWYRRQCVVGAARRAVLRATAL